MRGVSLFIKYIPQNALSIVAVTALFATFHLLFFAGGALRDFAAEAARFDTIRVYAAQFPPALMDRLSAAEGVDSVETVYSPSDTKDYLVSSAAFADTLKMLPTEFFPSFAEIKVKPEYRNTEALRRLADELSGASGVETVSFGEKWVSELSALRLSLDAVLAVCAALFAVTCGIIIYQTVSVTLYRYRREVRIYAVVGGTHSFIIIPFVVVSACISLICAILSFVIFTFLANFLLASVQGVINIPFVQNVYYWAVFAAFALASSMFAGYTSARHFLIRRLA
jgi:cell division transport system permease protein